MDKRGFTQFSLLNVRKGSHVGMVLSFVIFVTFLIFLYTSLEPVIKKQEELYGSLERVKENILEFLYENLTIVAVKNGTARGENSCLKIEKTKAVKGDNFIVKDVDGNVVSSYLGGDNLYLEWKSGINIFRVYSSDGELINPPSQIDCSKSGNGVVASVQTRKFIFWNKTNEILDGYDENYESLIEMFEISPNDFGFGIEYKNGTKIEKMKENLGQNIFVKETSVEYTNETAGTSLVKIYIKLW